MLKRLTLALVVMCVAVSQPGADPVEVPAPTPDMTAALVDELERAYPDHNEAMPAPERIDAPRASIAGVHVLVNHAKPDAEITLSATGADGLNVRWYRLLDVPVRLNTGMRGATTARADNHNPHVTREAPFRTYDAMQPVASPLTADVPTLLLRAEFDVPGDATPGERDVSLQVGELRLEFKLVVHEVVVPPVGRESFAYTNWMDWHYGARHYGIPRWSDAHWEVIRKYARLMVRARQNTLCLWMPLLFDGEEATLNTERLKRIVDIITEEGIWWLEGGHLAQRAEGKWFADHFVVRHGVPATSAEGNRLLAHMCGQLMQAIRDNGWEDRWIQHITDEPIPQNVVDYRILNGMVRKYMPGIPILDAVMETSIVGSVDIWCPKAHEYEQNRDFFEAQREVGDRIWVYTCLHPGGRWMNRLLDFEPLRPLLIGWACALFGIDGFLHWGLNQWNEDPFTVGNQMHGEGPDHRRLPAGDTHIAYAGDLQTGPWSSQRMEAHRIGFEDLELLRMLQARDAEGASALIASICRGFEDYTLEISEYRAARRKLLEALSR